VGHTEDAGESGALGALARSGSAQHCDTNGPNPHQLPTACGPPP
jgi:hypothetical protein